MKWETIKSNCVRSAITEIRSWHVCTGERLLLQFRLILNNEVPERTESNNGSAPWRIQKTLEDKIVNIIRSWDIREYERLKTLYPKHFPKKINGFELTDNGWNIN